MMSYLCNGGVCGPSWMRSPSPILGPTGEAWPWPMFSKVKLLILHGYLLYIEFESRRLPFLTGPLWTPTMLFIMTIIFKVFFFFYNFKWEIKDIKSFLKSTHLFHLLSPPTPPPPRAITLLKSFEYCNDFDIALILFNYLIKDCQNNSYYFLRIFWCFPWLFSFIYFQGIGTWIFSKHKNFNSQIAGPLELSN